MIGLPLDFIIQTERLLLRIPNESDIPHVLTASKHPGFTDGMLWSPPKDLKELQGPYERSVADWASSSSYQFSIDASEEFVGRIALRPSDEPDVLDIGYWTHPHHFGKGYMTEAGAAILRLGFHTMGARAIVAGTADWNIASQKVLDKLGFQRVQVITGGFVKGDRICDEWIYRLTQ